MNAKPKTWAAALLLGVLLVGGVAGVAVDRVVAGRLACQDDPERETRDRRGSYVDWLAEELSLNPEQRTQVEAYIDRHREAVSALWREMRPQFEARKAQLRDDIRRILDDEQRAAYEALLAREAERGRHNRRGGR